MKLSEISKTATHRDKYKNYLDRKGTLEAQLKTPNWNGIRIVVAGANFGDITHGMIDERMTRRVLTALLDSYRELADEQRRALTELGIDEFD